MTGSLWSSGKGEGFGCLHISSSIHLPCETKSHFPGHLHGYGLLHFSPFEYPGDSLSVGCTSHPGVRSVSLIDPDLTLYVYKKKICKVYFIFFAFDDETSVSMILVYFKYVYIYMCVCFSKTIFCQNMQSMLYIL